MLRGCQKKIVFLKNTGSKIFDEAYFVISAKDEASDTSSEKMIDEAKRIIAEATFEDGTSDGGVTFRKRFFKYALPFLAGGVVSGVLTSVIFILIG
ncbi:MAG: hypothetical protein IJW48_01550 [Clostridia bacterium]|nr:hypothetical protein [Clostridia bacterium]